MIKCEKDRKEFQMLQKNGEKHSMIWGMFMAVTMEISNIRGKESPEQLSLHCEHNTSHTQTNVRHIYEIGV